MQFSVLECKTAAKYAFHDLKIEKKSSYQLIENWTNLVEFVGEFECQSKKIQT